MMGPRHLLATAMLLAMGACAALNPAPPLERDASYRLERGLAALQAGHYRESFEDLAWVYANCVDHSRGAQALVGLAALELDPRNEAGRPGLATDLVSRIIREPAPEDYVRPLAESAYLMALALGAPPAPPAEPSIRPASAEQPAPAAPAAVVASDSLVAGIPVPPAPRPTWEALEPASEQQGAVYGCGRRIAAEGWVPPPLPSLAGPSLVAQLAGAERARDAARSDADSLRQELDAARQRLAETEAELERIRRTLKP